MSRISVAKYYVVKISNAPKRSFRLRLTLIQVSQFTLLASTKKGSKPDFHGAMGGDQAKELYQLFVRRIQEGYQREKVKDGVFQAKMEVALVNDGPVTLEMSTGS